MTNEEAKEFIVQSVKDDVDIAKVADAIKVLEQQPCDDCISREDALKLMCDKCPMHNCVTGCSSYRHIEKMSSVTPTRPKGKWVNNIHDIPICDQCGYMTPYDRAIDDYEYGNFCPNCGAKMEEQIKSESEDKEAKDER